MREVKAQKIVQRAVDAMRIRREALGWSQRALASKAGVDPKTVSLIERGTRNPTLFTLSLLASALDLPLSQVMEIAESDTTTGE